MKIVIGIPTYERIDLLKSTARSLSLLEPDVEKFSIRIYDDCSSSYTADDIRALIPNCEKITVRDRRVGADLNTYLMYRDFLLSNADILFTVDSDLFLHPDALKTIIRLLPHTDGVLSLYNSCAHPAEEVIQLVGESVLLKNSIGAAGTSLSRKVVEEIIERVPPSDSFDWDFSDFWIKQGKRLIVTESSYVQHLGFLAGYNADRTQNIDFGLNFKSGNPIVDRILLEEISRAIVDPTTGVSAKVQSIYNSLSYKIGHFLLFPFKALRQRLFPRSRPEQI